MQHISLFADLLLHCHFSFKKYVVFVMFNSLYNSASRVIALTAVDFSADNEDSFNYLFLLYVGAVQRQRVIPVQSDEGSAVAVFL